MDVIFSSTRTRCGVCNARHGKATIVKYFDFDVSSGEYFKCFACDTLITPKRNSKAVSSSRVKTSTTSDNSLTESERRALLDKYYLESSANQSNLTKMLYEYANKGGWTNRLNKHLKHWRVGADVSGNHIYWYFDINNNLKTAKCIPYGNNGKRLKGDKSTISVGETKVDAIYGYVSDSKNIYFSKKNGFDNNLLYGIWQLNDNAKDTVILVESEKNALLGSLYMKEFIWVATGGVSGLTRNKALQLLDRSVVILFDNDKAGREKTYETANVLSSLGIEPIYEDSNGKMLIDRYFPSETGYDIGDFVIDKMKKSSETNWYEVKHKNKVFYIESTSSEISKISKHYRGGVIKKVNYSKGGGLQYA